MKIDRPSFLAGAASAASLALGALPAVAALGDRPIPKRRLGRTNAMVTIVGMGGYHIGQSQLSGADATTLIHGAIDRGIMFMDNAWDYNMGASELRMGQALNVGGYRDRVFLMTKIDGRTKDAAAGQIEQSLSRLLVDHIDLVQIHENIRPDDADRVFAPGGAIEALVAAQKAGKIRFIGFTGHKTPKYHLHMLDVAKANGFTFDTVQMPLNVMDAHYDSFEKLVLPRAKALDMGVIGMKTFGDHHILDTGALDPVTMLHYGFNLPVATIVTGIDKPMVLDQAITAAQTFAPLSQAQVAAILAKTEKLAQGGTTELYKSSHIFDGTIQNPQWLDVRSM
jgi:diketogulonate reductase-like aldo/keto reductase